MDSALIYRGARFDQIGVDRLARDCKRALLFFERLYIKSDTQTFVDMCKDDPATLGWLRDEGFLISISSEEYMSGGVYDLQDQLLKRIIEDPRTLHVMLGGTTKQPKGEPSTQFLLEEGWQAVSTNRLGRKPANGSVPSSILAELRDRGLAIEVGSNVPTSRPGRPVGVYDPLLSPAESTEVPYEIDRAPDRSIVLLHPRLFDIHIALIHLTAPLSVVSTGERLTPVTGFSLFGHRSHVYDVLYRTVRALADVEGTALIGTLIKSDTEGIGVDVAGVNLEDLLSFRARYRRELTDYRRTLQDLVRGASLRADHDTFVREVSGELASAAGSLRRQAIRRFGVGAGTLGVGVAGFAWSVEDGHTVTALLSILAGILGAAAVSPVAPRHDYAYLMHLRQLG